VFRYEAYIPGADVLGLHLLQYLGYCIMVKGPRLPFELASAMYEDCLTSKDEQQLHRAAVNALKLKEAYWLIILPDPAYKIVGDTIDVLRTSSKLGKGDVINTIKKEQRCFTITWQAVLEKGPSVLRANTVQLLDNDSGDEDDSEENDANGQNQGS
jgi:hypothetical protein